MGQQRDMFAVTSGFAAGVDARLAKGQFVFTIPEIAGAFGCGDDKVRDWIDEGRIPAVNYGPNDGKRIFRATRNSITEFAKQLEGNI